MKNRHFSHLPFSVTSLLFEYLSSQSLSLSLLLMLSTFLNVSLSLSHLVTIHFSGVKIEDTGSPFFNGGGGLINTNTVVENITSCPQSNYLLQIFIFLFVSVTKKVNLRTQEFQEQNYTSVNILPCSCIYSSKVSFLTVWYFPVKDMAD